MAAKKNPLENEDGAGLVELIGFIPLIMIFFYIMYNAHYTILTSINSQVWVRERLNYQLGNSAFYPVNVTPNEADVGVHKGSTIFKNRFHIGLHYRTFDETENPIPMERNLIKDGTKEKAKVRTLIGICTYDISHYEKNSTPLNDNYVQMVLDGGHTYCEQN